MLNVYARAGAVTTTRAHVHYVVTEYGRAMLFGRSTAERARMLISIAAPQFREQLERLPTNCACFIDEWGVLTQATERTHFA